MYDFVDDQTECTLDPQNWDSMRALGHRMIDDMIDHLQTIRETPVWQHAPDEVKAHFNAPLPIDPQSPEEIYNQFQEYVLPYPIGNTHPRFWGWLFGTGTIFGAYAEFLSAVMNTNSGDMDHHSAIHVEKQVIDWIKELMMFPAAASGLLTSGCSAANLIGLTVARNAKSRTEIRTEGFQNITQKMVLYASEEIHASIQRAVEILGLGSNALRYIPVNQEYQIDLDALRAAISADRQAGFHPFCIIGAAGTTNTGASDDLNALADICEQENLWLHVDGAFGAWAAIVPEVKDQVGGIERADSLALDLHKWMYMPFEIGCVLVRHEGEHRKAFSQTPVYISREGDGRGLTGGDLPWFTNYGFQLSTAFRALKAWMSLKQHGVRKYARMIGQNIEQVQYLVRLIEAIPELELAAPVPLNVVCFRFVQPGLDGLTIDNINKEIIVELQERGIAVLSGTTIQGKYVLRLGHTNHRSRKDDFNLLVRETVRIGKELAS